MKAYAGLGADLAKSSDSVYMEAFSRSLMQVGPYHTVAPFAADGKLDTKENGVSYISLSPLNAEDDQGKIVFRPGGVFLGRPFCFDLSDIAVDRIPAYLNFLFKQVK